MKDYGLEEITLNPHYIDEIINRALKEDLGPGDTTTDNIVPGDKSVRALMKTKEDGIIAGIEIAERVFSILDPGITMKPHFTDGDKISAGDVILEMEGSYRALLSGERTALNFLQRMSGIATETDKFVRLLKPYKTRILDTRKTVPGLRLLDKYAVKCGGGTNHRTGLYDMVMIKDNHIKIAGGIKEAVKKIRNTLDNKFKIEVETSNLPEIEQAIEAGVDIIMLDNMDNETMATAVSIINKEALTEASGNMKLERVKEVAECGVDFISVGTLTHSVKAIDIGMYLVN